MGKPTLHPATSLFHQLRALCGSCLIFDVIPGHLQRRDIHHSIDHLPHHVIVVQAARPPPGRIFWREQPGDREFSRLSSRKLRLAFVYPGHIGFLERIPRTNEILAQATLQFVHTSASYAYVRADTHQRRQCMCESQTRPMICFQCGS